MSENNGVTRLPNGAVAKRKPSATAKITIDKADKWIASAGLKRVKAFKVRSHAKVGSFIAQEGEIDQARTMLRENYEGLLEQQEYFEGLIEKAKDDNRMEDVMEYSKMLMLVLHEINNSAKFMIQAKMKQTATQEDQTVNDPKMPARAQITNNNQIVVGVTTNREG